MASPTQTAASPQARSDYDPTTQFVEDLRNLGWKDADFERFTMPDCEQLRTTALNYMRSVRS